LVTLQAITILNLLSDNIKDKVNELSTLSVMTLGKIVSSTRLAENKVVWPKNLAIRTGPDGIHGARLKVH
jgi:hypothetical protein